MSKAVDLARLASDERTPENERIAAALALAKIVARDGLPSGRTDRPSIALQRERDALAAIAAQNALEIQTLRADKADLEKRVAHLRTEYDQCAAHDRRNVESANAVSRRLNALLDALAVLPWEWRLELVEKAQENEKTRAAEGRV